MIVILIASFKKVLITKNEFKKSKQEIWKPEKKRFDPTWKSIKEVTQIQQDFQFSEGGGSTCDKTGIKINEEWKTLN